MQEPTTSEVPRPNFALPPWAQQLALGVLVALSVPATTKLIAMDAEQKLQRQQLEAQAERDRIQDERMAEMAKTSAQVQALHADVQVLHVEIRHVKEGQAELKELLQER